MIVLLSALPAVFALNALDPEAVPVVVVKAAEPVAVALILAASAGANVAKLVPELKL